jgi:hypothetical protein
MAIGRRIKTEMKGTGGGRWMHRAEAKYVANKVRRTADKNTVEFARTDCHDMTHEVCSCPRTKDNNG